MYCIGHYVMGLLTSDTIVYLRISSQSDIGQQSYMSRYMAVSLIPLCFLIPQYKTLVGKQS